jgi:hypothetical protein
MTHPLRFCAILPWLLIGSAQLRADFIITAAHGPDRATTSDRQNEELSPAKALGPFITNSGTFKTSDSDPWPLTEVPNLSGLVLGMLLAAGPQDNDHQADQSLLARSGAWHIPPHVLYVSTNPLAEAENFLPRSEAAGSQPGIQDTGTPLSAPAPPGTILFGLGGFCLTCLGLRNRLTAVSA